jgi:hypothetical protein
MRSTAFAHAYRYYNVRHHVNIRAFFGAVVLLSCFLSVTVTTMIFPWVDVDNDSGLDAVEQELLHLVSRNATASSKVEVPSTPTPASEPVLRLPSTSMHSVADVPSSDHKEQRMSKQERLVFPANETALLPPKNCSFTTKEQQMNFTSNHNNIVTGTDMDTAFAQTVRIATTRHKPIWIPGYPGSGSELLRDLIQIMTMTGSGDVDGNRDVDRVGRGDNLTRTATADIYDDDTHRCRHAVTCKTHWPAYPRMHAPHQPKYLEYFASNVILLLRNPANALPSHFNFRWEVEHNVAHHTTQAPEADWIVWRNQRFGRQLQNWKNMILQWHNQHAGDAGDAGDADVDAKAKVKANEYYHVALYVPYERLVSPDLSNGGPVLAAKLANELRRASGTALTAGGVIDNAGAIDIPCVWRTVVLDQPRKQRQRSQHEKDQRYQPSYTVEQQQLMVDMLQDIMLQLPDNLALNEILTEYLHEIKTNLSIDDG